MSAVSSESLDEAERVRDARTRARARLAATERQAEAVVGGGVLLAALAPAWLASPGPALSLVTAASCAAALAIASRVSFDVGGGFTVPTQVAFVPMALSLPAPLVAPLTVLALALGMAPDVVSV